MPAVAVWRRCGGAVALDVAAARRLTRSRIRIDGRRRCRQTTFLVSLNETWWDFAGLSGAVSTTLPRTSSSFESSAPAALLVAAAV